LPPSNLQNNNNYQSELISIIKPSINDAETGQFMSLPSHQEWKRDRKTVSEIERAWTAELQTLMFRNTVLVIFLPMRKNK